MSLGMSEITRCRKLIDLSNTYNQNAEFVEVNIGFDCENVIVLENE